MSLRVSNLTLPVEEPEVSLLKHLANSLGVAPTDIRRFRILRKALDLRDKRQLRFTYNFEVEAEDVGQHSPGVQVEAFDEPPFAMPPPGNTPLEHRPVVVGSGPGGLVCAYFLAKH